MVNNGAKKKKKSQVRDAYAVEQDDAPLSRKISPQR